MTSVTTRATNQRRHVVVAATVMALLAMLAPLSLAEAKPKPSPAARAQAAVTDDGLDLSATLPNSTRDDLTGDFLNKGYAQRMRVEGNQLNIYEPDALGGELLQSTDSDLDGGGGALFYPPDSPLPPTPVYQFSAFTSIRFQDGDGWPQIFDKTYNLSSVFLAAIDGWIFIAGTKGINIDPLGKQPNPYQTLIYKVKFDQLNNKCALQSCATQVLSLPTFFAGRDPTTGYTEDRAVGVTQLSAGYAGGKPYLAVGMSDCGLQIYDMDLSNVGSFGGMNNPGDPASQTAITALAWDPAGKAAGSTGLITLGIMTAGFYGYMFDVNSDGSVQSDFRVYTGLGGITLTDVPLSVAIGRRPNDPRPVAAFVGSKFTTTLVDTTLTNGSPLATATIPGGGVAVNAVPRPDSTGGTDWAVATQDGAGDDGVGKVVGVMLRDDGTNSLKAQPLGVDDQGNAVTQLSDAASYRSWFPGYKQGRFALTNNSADEVTVQLAADSASRSGCWYAPDGDPDALPANGVVLEPGESSGYYTLGAYTAGVGEGGCATVPSDEDQSGAWRGYVTVTPTNRPADTRLVNVQLNRNWSVDPASDQTGGSITLTPPAAPDPTPTGKPGMPYGYQTFSIDGPAAPVATVAPTLAIHQVSGSVRFKTNGVYRIDVGASTWTLTGSTTAAPQIQAVLPPFRVQGLYQGVWSDIGGFLPLGKLSAKNSTDAKGVVTSTVSVSGGTFFWENVWGSTTPYTQLQVVLGTGSNPPTSNPVTLAGAPTYGPSQDIAQFTLSPPTGGATPVPNGIDAIPIQLATNATNGPTKLPSDPAYKSIYYRAGTTLITNLYPVVGCSNPDLALCYDYDSFIGVQPSVTSYPVGGQTATRQSSLSAYDYLSTTLTKAEGTIQITGYVGVAASPTAPATVNVAAGTAVPSSTLSGDGRKGFSVEGCNEFSPGGTCRLPTIVNPNTPSSTTTQPALYQAGSGENPAGPLLGMQMITQAQTADALPLIWTSNYAPKLTSSVVAAPSSSYSVKLQSPDKFPAYSDGTNSITPQVDATLVSHGVSVTITAIPVPPPPSSGAAKNAKKGRR